MNEEQVGGLVQAIVDAQFLDIDPAQKAAAGIIAEQIGALDFSAIPDQYKNEALKLGWEIQHDDKAEAGWCAAFASLRLPLPCVRGSARAWAATAGIITDSEGAYGW